MAAPGSQRTILVAWAWSCIFSTCMIVATHCVQHYEDHSSASLSEESQYHYVDPLDMGSYSHSTQRNMIKTNRRLQHDAQIDEVTEKRTIYHAHDFGGKIFGAGDDDDHQSMVPHKIPIGVGQGAVEVLEKNVKYKDSAVIVCGICPTLDEASVMVYTKRIVTSLLRQMNVRNHIFGPNEAITIDLQAELSHEDFTKLDRFINNQSTRSGTEAITELAMVTDIIGNLLHYVYPEPTITWMEYVQEKINFQYLWTLKFWINLISLTSVTILVLVLLHRACTSPHPVRAIFYIALLFFIISCVSVFSDLYESARAENHARLHQYDQVPNDCNYNEFGLMDSIGYYFRVHVFKHKDQCVDYHKQMLGETYYHATPVEAISETLSKSIFHPMEYVGERMGKFFGGVIAVVPFWLQPVLLMLVFVFGFLAIFRFRITSPFISIEPAPAHAPPAAAGGYLEGSPNHQPAPQPAAAPGQAIIERAAGDMVRTSTGKDISTNTDDLEDYIRGQGAYSEERQHQHQREGQERRRRRRRPSTSVPAWWTILQDYFWILYQGIVYYLNILLREVPSETAELVLDDEGAFQVMNRNEDQDQEFQEPELELELELEPVPHIQLRQEDLEIDVQFLADIIEPEPEIVYPVQIHPNANIKLGSASSVSSSSSSASSTRNTPIFDRPHLKQHSSSSEWVYVDEDSDADPENADFAKATTRPKIYDGDQSGLRSEGRSPLSPKQGSSSHGQAQAHAHVRKRRRSKSSKHD